MKNIDEVVMEAHGMRRTRFYGIWCNIKQRCGNPNSTRYYNYGGRGITVCESWFSFNNFMKDMYKAYIEHIKAYGEKNTTIERKDNDKGYSLENCKWATRAEQHRNTRTNIIYKGETATDASYRLNGSYNLIRNRIQLLGWSLEKAYSTIARVRLTK